MRADEFDFDLPPAQIAQRPARPRDAARLLRVAADGLSDHVFRDLPALLAPGDLLVVNDAKVIPARLSGRRRGAKVEVTLHLALGPERWRAFARPARKLAPGDVVAFADGFSAEVEAREGAEAVLRFDRGGGALMAALEAHGTLPLPPYVKRPDGPDADDRADYQTMFAARPGAVAAPTAALHFTPAVTAALAARGVATTTLTLHVGAGTFLPVTAERIEDHRMHAEWAELPQAAADAVARTKAAGGKVVAVGTTALRTLEAGARPDGGVDPWSGTTELFIRPGGPPCRVADRLLTNLHLPRSTLFMLVCAFAGTARMRAAYAHAVASGYRFFSYGDSTLLDRMDAA